MWVKEEPGIHGMCGGGGKEHRSFVDYLVMLFCLFFCRALQSRLILIIIVVLEILILIAVLSYKLYKKFNN